MKRFMGRGAGRRPPGGPRDLPLRRERRGREALRRGRHPRRHADRGVRRDPAGAEAARAGGARRPPGRLRHHRARLLRRRAAPGDEGRGPPRRARRAPPPERADRGRARLRPRQAQRGARSPSTISAAAPSTCRSFGCRATSSRCSRPAATRTSAATTSIGSCARRLLADGLEPRTATPSPAVLRGAVAAAQRIRETLSSEDAVVADVELPEGFKLRARASPAPSSRRSSCRSSSGPPARAGRRSATRARRRSTASSSSAGRRAPRSSAAT